MVAASYCAIAAWMLPHWGTVGLVLANCLHMAARATIALVYLRTELGKLGATPSLRHVMPHAHLSAALIVSFLLTAASNHHWNQVTMRGKLAHIAVGVACLAGVVLALWKAERQRIQHFRQLLRSKPKAA